MLSRFSLGLSLAVLFLFILFTLAPARLLGLLLPSDKVVMQGFSGTLWQGAAARTLVAAGHGYIELGQVTWELAPLSLFTLSPTIDFDSRWGGQSVSATIKLRGVQSADFTNLDANARLDPDVFVFNPPEGVDVFEE